MRCLEKAGCQDLPEMLEIWNDVVREGEAFPQEEELDAESAKTFFGQQSWCAVIRERPGGSILGLYILHPNNVGRCGHICNASYAVRKDARGAGLGRALVLDSLEQARRLGFRIMQFNAVCRDNKWARKLYADLGFKQLGEIEGGFRNKKGEYRNICLYWKNLGCFPSKG